jgi:DNA-binding transcriptional regulator YdaS (Cro superfamily)
MDDRNQQLSGIADAVMVAGTQADLANDLGVSQQVVSKWQVRGWVPLKRAGQIEERYKISRMRLVNPKILALVGSPAKEAP